MDSAVAVHVLKKVACASARACKSHLCDTRQCFCYLGIMSKTQVEKQT